MGGAGVSAVLGHMPALRWCPVPGMKPGLNTEVLDGNLDSFATALESQFREIFGLRKSILHQLPAPCAAPRKGGVS